jgi:hypothetical protein
MYCPTRRNATGSIFQCGQNLSSILPAAICFWGWLSFKQKWVPGIFLRGKALPALKANNVTTLYASTPCYRNRCGNVALRIVRGDKRQTSVQRYNWATPFLRDINTGTWPSRLAESQMRQYNTVPSAAERRPQSDCSGKAQKQLYK